MIRWRTFSPSSACLNSSLPFSGGATIHGTGRGEAGFLTAVAVFAAIVSSVVVMHSSA